MKHVCLGILRQLWTRLMVGAWTYYGQVAMGSSIFAIGILRSALLFRGA